MKKLLYIVLVITFIGCSDSSENEDLNIGDSPTEFTFINNIHGSLSHEWISEFNEIMGVLKQLIPTNPDDYFYELPIYAWNGSAERRY